MKFFLAIFLLAVAGLVGWYGYCVVPVMQDFQAAADTGKPEAILPFIDMPSLKKDITEFVKNRFNRTDNPATNPSAEQIQEMVDSFTTPANILLILKGVKVEPGRAVPAVMDDKTPHPVEKHYESPGVYAIDIYLSQVQTPDNKVSLLFERQGWFDWKLSAIRFSWS
ncbi:MAG TPA: hypothetical protein VHE12_13685 [bacterium]|nr:hypothetical protein [bacterium]